MAGIGSMVTAAQIAASIDRLRFDKRITAFEFKPSLGIVAKQLDAFGEAIKDMREPLTKSVREVMGPSIQQNFVSGGRPTWEPLSPATLARRKDDGAILVRTGSLGNVASSPRIWSIGSTSATIRDLPEKVWYGKVHQEGHAGDQFSGGNWFKKYQTAARKIAGPDEDDKTVDEIAFKLFDKRIVSHGPAPKGSPSIPARPFAVFQDEDLDDIQLIFAEWLEDKLRTVGRFR